MNKFLQLLYDEHEVIVEAIEALKKAGSLIGKDNEAYSGIVKRLITFFREYADKYHHYKEEEILFPEMMRKNEMLATGIVKEMFDNHGDFREMTAGIIKLLDDKEYTRAHQQAEFYAESLLGHIAAENEEVFQIAADIFDDIELERISSRFEDCDRELGNERKSELSLIASRLHKEIKL